MFALLVKYMKDAKTSECRVPNQQQIQYLCEFSIKPFPRRSLQTLRV